jgi:serine/threonine protein kinase
MNGAFRIDRVAAASARFAAHHGLGTPAAGNTIALGEEVGRGGFGTVFAVAAIGGGAPARPLLLKVFDDAGLWAAVEGGAARIAAGVSDLIARLKERTDEEWPDLLLALPFGVVFGRGGSGSSLAVLMLDLRHLGYEPSPFGDNAEMTRYLARPLVDRQDLAASFIRKAELLEEIGFIHGDLNAQNLLLSYTRRDVQVIDVDAGALIVRGDERPLTPGKPDGFMPPEVKQPAVPGQIDMSAYLPSSERWSVACVVGYLIFGSHPGFFLEEISAASIRGYAEERPGWPEIDPRSRLFTSVPENRAAYAAMRVVFDSLPDEIISAFRKLFAAGLDADQRPTAPDWTRALTTMCSPPRFTRLEADGTCVIAGMPVTVAWKAEAAARVEVLLVTAGGEVRPVGDFRSAGSLEIELPESAGFVLVARNPYGDVHGIAGPIRVLPMPQLALRRPSRPVLRYPPLDGPRALPLRYSLPSAPPLRPAHLRPPRPTRMAIR